MLSDVKALLKVTLQDRNYAGFQIRCILFCVAPTYYKNSLSCRTILSLSVKSSFQYLS